MFIQDWIYFVKVAECHSIQSASEQLYRTYQGVYKSIARLEDELGRPLFHKDKNTLQLTEFGTYVKDEFADKLISYWDGISNCAESYDHSTSRSLRIGLVNECEKFAAMDKVVQRFQDAHPGADIVTVRSGLHVNYVNVENDILDIAISMQIPHTEHLGRCTSIPMEWFVFVNNRSTLAAKDSVTADDLRKRSLLFLLDGSIVSQYIRERFKMDANNFMVCPAKNPNAKAILDEDLAVRVTSLWTDVAPEGFYENCRCMSFEPPVKIDIGFVYKERPEQKQLLLDFIDFFNQEFKKA